MKTDHIIALALSLAVGYIIYLIMSPFFIPAFWGICLVILFYPLYRKVFRRLKNRTASSLAICVLVAVFIIMPSAYAGSVIAGELVSLYQWAETYLKTAETRVHSSPLFLMTFLERYLGRYIDLPASDLQGLIGNVLREGSSYVSAGITGAIKTFTEFLFNFILSFFVMFFLFRDGERLLAAIKDCLPVTDEDRDKLINRTRTVLTATFYGGVLIGAILGALGGAAFWALGVPAPILWGFAMLIASFLPGVGTALIWAPAVIYLFVTGSATKAAILLVWCILMVILVDNFLRQAIVSGKTNLHPLLLFFSVLGAVRVFGVIGIVAGPVVLGVTITGIEIYRHSAGRKRHT